MDFIEVKLTIQGITKDHIIKLNGTIIKYNKLNYLITLHHGLPIKLVTITIDDIDINISEFDYCIWNELIMVKDFKNIRENQFVFKQFVKKQIDSSIELEINKTDICRFIENVFFPINMMPENPINLYYKLSNNSDKIKKGSSGIPIHTKDKKLIGIFSKKENNSIYVIPIIYILKSIEKTDNDNIYFLDENNINKINNYMVKEKKIYHNQLKTIIPIDTYLVLEGDIDKMIYITDKKLKSRYHKFKILETVIKNNKELVFNNQNISITSSFLHYLRIIGNKDFINIFKNIKKNYECNIMLNEKKYICKIY